MVRYWLILLLMVLPAPAPGQNLAFINYTRENGLPSNTVYNIFRDSKGLLWIGTDKGVVTYNGINFETYTTANGLADNEVYFFQEDHEHRVWMSTANGKLCYFQNGKFFNASNTPFLAIGAK